MKKIITFLAAIILFLPAICADAGIYDIKPHDISTRLMRSTFKIQGKNKKGTNIFGTVFIVAEQDIKDPNFGYYVLLTAAHVLEDIKDNTATIILRRLTGDTFVKYPYSINIRDNGKPLWVRHPKVDVAAMRVGLPKDADIHLIATNLLATDKMLEKYEIHPGDDLLVLGYPYGQEANEAGFPILRSGKIASFPLTPTEKTLSFLLDFPVYEGNSGGPVFLYSQNRFYGGRINLGLVKFVVGIVSREWKLTEKLKTLDEFIIREHKLGLAVIIHARFLKDLVEMLPSIDE